MKSRGLPEVETAIIVLKDLAVEKVLNFKAFHKGSTGYILIMLLGLYTIPNTLKNIEEIKPEVESRFIKLPDVFFDTFNDIVTNPTRLLEEPKEQLKFQEGFFLTEEHFGYEKKDKLPKVQITIGNNVLYDDEFARPIK